MLKIDLAGYRKIRESAEPAVPVDIPAEQIPAPEEYPAAPAEEAEPFAPLPEEEVPAAPDEELPGTTEETTVPLSGRATEGPTPETETPAPSDETDFTLLRSEPASSVKIPLSPRGPHEDSDGISIPPPGDESVEADAEPSEKGGSRMRTPLLIILLCAVAAFGIYTQKKRIVGLVVRKPAPTAPKPVPAQPAPAKPDSASAPAAGRATEKTDPSLDVLARIDKAVPPQVWLSETSVTVEGNFELKGVAFAYEALQAFAAALKAAGTVVKESIPAKSASPETVYSFGFSGKLSDVPSTGVLDAIPSDRLAALGDSLKASAKSAGATFVRLPRANAKYGESDLPFEAVGPYAAIERVLGGITAPGTVAVQRIVVHAVPGMPADRVRTKFSLRAVSSL